MMPALSLWCATVAIMVLNHPIRGQEHLGKVWTKMSEPMSTISVGQAGVWVVDADNKLFYRVGTYNSDGAQGSKWLLVDDSTSQVSVGTNITWVLGLAYQVYYRGGISAYLPEGHTWYQIDGELAHISVSQRNHLWGVSVEGNVFRRLGTSTERPQGYTWKLVEGSLKQVSVGGAGVWGVNSKNEVYCRIGTFGDLDTDGASWVFVPNQKMKYIASGEWLVWAVDPNNNVFRRVGVSKFIPTGVSWQEINVTLSHVDIWTATVWGVDPGNMVSHYIL